MMAIPQWVAMAVAAGGIAFITWWSRNKSNVPAKVPLPKSFDDAAKLITNWQHAPAKPLAPYAPWPEAPRAVTFEIPAKIASGVLEQLRDKWTQAGLLLVFLRDPSPLDARPAIVAMFDTTDPFLVLRHVAPGEDVVADELVSYLRTLYQTEPFRLVSASGKHATIAFTAPVRKAGPIAKRIAELCPEMFEGEELAVDDLARDIEAKGSATFSWD